MQNLSLQVAQTAPVKSMSDATNKNDGNTDKSASTETNNAFQMLLSRQVLAKQSQDASDNQAIARQTSAKQIPAKQVTAEHAVSEPTLPAKNDTKAVTKPGTAEAGKADNDKAELKKADTDAASVIAGIQAELDAKGVGSKKKEIESKPDDTTIVATDANAVNLAAPIINAIPLVNTQSSVSVTDSQLSSRADATGQKQQSLDTALSNALSQGKGGNIQAADAQENDALDIQGGKNSSEHARWLDVMLPNAPKQTAGDDAATSKLMLNAINESSAKDAISPTASYQPATQANVNQISAGMAAQQLGSANIINAYPGKSGWDQAISQKVMWMVGSGEQSASLTLNPPDMGPLQVVIHVHNDQADTTFISDNAEVRQALQDGMANLRDKMSESGIQLGQANVSSGGQAQQDFQQAAQNRLASQRNDKVSSEPIVEQVTNTSTLVRIANGLVDTFA